jgi:hypothetical protein
MQFMFNIFFPENRGVYDKMWKNMEQPNVSQLKK